MPKTRRPAAAIIDRLETRMLLSRAVGADISQYQGAMNWTTFKNANGGQNFAFIRASSSDFGANADSNGNAVDTKFNANATSAKSAGVLYGVYHFGDPTNNLQTAVQQANYFLSVAQSRMTTGYLPPVLDLEVGGGTLTNATLSQWANDFCNTIFTATGVKPLIYCNTNYAQNFVLPSVNQWPLWIANWTTTTYGNPVTGTGSPPVGRTSGGTLVNGWPAGQWKFWQYAAGGDGLGATYGASSADIDVDVYNGDATALQSFVIGAPEVTVLQNSTNIVDGSTTPFNFGSVTQGQSGASYTFTVRNDGGQLLTLSGLTVPTGYTITDNLVSSLTSGQSDNFTVRLDSAVAGLKSGNISFTNNDSNENPFNFAITGSVNAVTVTAPSNLHTTSIGTTSVQLAWNDNSSNESQFLIERKLGAGPWSQIGQTSANTASLTDNAGLQSATQYYYRVRAFDGNQTYSSYTTPDLSVLTMCDAPAGLAASDGISTTQVHLSWVASAGAASYQLYRGTVNDPAQAGLLAPSSTTSFDDVGATPGVTYYYWVAAKDSLSRMSAKSAGDGGYRAVDTTPPTLIASSFDYVNPTQPLDFTFSEDVSATVSTANLTVQNLDTLTDVPVGDFTYDFGANMASFFFASAPLADGHYRATLDGSQISDAQGNPLGSNVTMDFFVLTGDANHDATVDTTDFNLMVANFGGAEKTYADGDFNYDGAVDTTDFNLLASNFGTSAASTPSAVRTDPAQNQNPAAQQLAWSSTLITSPDHLHLIDSILPG